jgi:uncharacterized OB-fold protein
MAEHKEANQYFDRILNEHLGRGICHTCGEIQAHRLRWCKNCGSEFCKHDHSLLEMMKIAKMARYENRYHGHELQPYYLSMIHKLHIKEAGFSEKDFEQYAESLLED